MAVVPRLPALPSLPAVLRDLIDKPARPAPAPVVDTRSTAERIAARLATEPSGSADENFARTVLDAAAREMSSAPDGARNDTLNRIAFDLYGLAKGGRLDASAVTETLTAAAMVAGGDGLKAKEIEATLGSAERMAEPKTGAPLRHEQEGPRGAPAGPSAAELVAAVASPPPESAPAQTPTAAPPAVPESRTERMNRELAESRATEVSLLAEEMRAKLLTDEQVVDLPPPLPLIKGLLMRDSLAVLYGKPGNGKSFVAVDWALSIAYGQWWDMRPIHQSGVLYIAAEGAPGLGKRVRAWKQHHGVHQHIPAFHLYPERINLLDSVAPAAMCLVAKWLGPGLIIVDTLSRSMPGGNENAPEDMTRALENADLLRRETGATVLIVHHTPKDGGSIRGHSSLEGAADTTIEVRKAEAVVTISVEKQKDAPEAAPIVRYLRAVQFGAEPDAEVDSAYLSSRGDADAEERATVSSQRELYILLDRNCARDEAMSGSRWMELAKGDGYSERTFHRAKKALADEGFVRNVGTVRTPKWKIAKPWS